MTLEEQVITLYTSDDQPSILDVAYELGIGHERVRRIVKEAGVTRGTADALRGRKRTTARKTTTPGPTARIAHPTVARYYR